MDTIKLPNIRKIFIPDVGWVVFDCDLSGADAQVVAWEAEDDDLKAAFRADIDVHAKNAEDMLGHEFTKLSKDDPLRKKKRQSNKHAVHGTNYGATPPGLAHHPSIGWTVHECDRFQKRWFSLHPKIGPVTKPGTWHYRIQQSINKFKMVQNKFGYRRVYFDRPDEVFTEALAWVPQSTVALVTFKGATRLLKEFLLKEPLTMSQVLRKGNPNIEMLLQVHDSIVFQVREMDAWQTKEMKRLLTVTIPYDDPLIIPWGFKRSKKSWGDLEEVPKSELAA
jgi:DNA polymerase-1